MEPELVRFYGGTPQQWAGTPWAVARRYYEAIPRIRRREQPAAAAPVVAAPTRELSAPAPSKQPSAAELRARLQEFGIGMGA
jgi:hypothetical protein